MSEFWTQVLFVQECPIFRGLEGIAQLPNKGHIGSNNLSFEGGCLLFGGKNALAL